VWRDGLEFWTADKIFTLAGSPTTILQSSTRRLVTIASVQTQFSLSTTDKGKPHVLTQRH